MMTILVLSGNSINVKDIDQKSDEIRVIATKDSTVPIDLLPYLAGKDIKIRHVQDVHSLQTAMLIGRWTADGTAKLVTGDAELISAYKAFSDEGSAGTAKRAKKPAQKEASVPPAQKQKAATDATSAATAKEKKEEAFGMNPPETVKEVTKKKNEPEGIDQDRYASSIKKSRKIVTKSVYAKNTEEVRQKLKKGGYDVRYAEDIYAAMNETMADVAFVTVAKNKLLKYDELDINKITEIVEYMASQYIKG